MVCRMYKTGRQTLHLFYQSTEWVHISIILVGYNKNLLLL